MTIRTLTGRARILAALGVTSLALVAASPASAIYRDYQPADGEAPVTERIVNQSNDTPVDENGNRYCALANPEGGATYVKHGQTITVTTPGDPKAGIGPTTLKYKCNDGKWDPVAAHVQASDIRYDAAHAAIDGSGELVLVNPHLDHAYPTDGVVYTQQ